MSFFPKKQTTIKNFPIKKNEFPWYQDDNQDRKNRKNLLNKKKGKMIAMNENLMLNDEKL